ncbi:MAG TPA: ATP-binding protein [Thermodesulfobacteriota bacterium]|nr:ATP-binding protein [Thermodesulfobacteriota bacterium]HNU72733.1 ATP-binding protein [Thermodesulfobacteriota bacterium]
MKKPEIIPILDPQERKRRRRERIIIIVTAVLIVTFTVLETYLSRSREQTPVTNNLLIYFLLNVNILLLILVTFLVIRNIVKLFFERRRGILGSKLRTKLIASFIGLSLVPTLILFWISVSFITNTIDNWFSFQLEKSLEESLEVAQAYYQDLSQNSLIFGKTISASIHTRDLLVPHRKTQLKSFIEAKAGEYNLGAVEIIQLSSEPRSVLKVSRISDPGVDPGLELNSEFVRQGFTGKEISKIQAAGSGELIRGIVPIRSLQQRSKVTGLVVVSYYLPQSLVKKMVGISNAYADYKRIKLTQSPIKANYIIFLSIVTLLIVFSAIMFGFHLSKNITGPIKVLAEGTQEVANGNLDIYIDVLQTDDEISSLVKSFNRMTQDLKTNKTQLEQTNRNLREINIELDQRRKYMEIILKNVAAGVISLDRNGRIATINRSVGEILGLDVETVLNKHYRDTLPPDYLQQVESLLQEVDLASNITFEKEITLTLPAKVLDLATYITPLKDERGQYLGLVIVLEDVTEQQRAQRIAAWREVARRIAHEIKNPLTPIQLSAQRLRRRYGDALARDPDVFDECTNTIISNVELLKNMVNEFNNFARMPATNPAPTDLHTVLQETLPLYREAHRRITFTIDDSQTVPVFSFDGDQVKRVIINILDNAVASIDGTGAITVKTFYDKAMNVAGVEIADTGCGIPADIKPRLFEPYFSTKNGGTGLGLSIVASIVSDHHGYVRIRDNNPKGTVFRVELPVHL